MTDLKKFLHAKFHGYDIRTKKDLTIKNNNNSADFITPSFARGCVASCSYCYSARHASFGNPLIIYENTQEIIDAVIKHFYKLPPKYPNHSNQQDRWQWCYDVGILSTNMI